MPRFEGLKTQVHPWQTPEQVSDHSVETTTGRTLPSHENSPFSRGKTEPGSNVLFIMVKYLLYLKILNEKKRMVFWKMKYNHLKLLLKNDVLYNSISLSGSIEQCLY